MRRPFTSFCHHLMSGCFVSIRTVASSDNTAEISTFVKTAAEVKAPPPLPHFEVNFEMGTGRFTLIGSGPCEGVFVSCVVPAQHKPRLLQLHDSGVRSTIADDGVSVDGHSGPSPAVLEQRLYHKHLWTSARQRLSTNRRKVQRRREVLQAEAHASSRTATLAAFLETQHNQKYRNTSPGASAARKPHNGSIGKMSLLCPPRSDPTPPAPESSVPPPPSRSTAESRLLSLGGDNNPANAVTADPFERERELHRRQYLALDNIVSEDGAEQVGVRFRVGVLRRKAPPVVTPPTDGEAIDVVADLMGMTLAENGDRPETRQSSPSTSNSVKYSSMMLHLSCSTIAPSAALSLDTVNFFNSPSIFLETSLENADEELRGYLGPSLHQRHLANYACNREGWLNRYAFADTSGHLDAVSNKNFFRTDVFPGASIADHAAHVPVHTVPPNLHDCIRQAVARRGIDDELSLYVHRYAQYVFAQERLLWRQRVVSFLKRGRLTPVASPQ